MAITKKLAMVSVLTGCLMGSLVGCGNRGGGSSGSGSAQPLAAVAGTWSVSLTTEDHPCDPAENGRSRGTETVILRQSEADVEIFQENGKRIASGTIDARNVIRLTGADDLDNRIELTVTPAANPMEFTLVGTSRERFDDCSEDIVVTIEGTRVSLSTDFPLPSCVSGEVFLSHEGVSGSTRQEASDFEPSCCDPNGSGPDFALLFTAPADSAYTFELLSLDVPFDFVIALYADDCVTELACSSDQPYRVSATLSEGDRVVVVVDGYSASSEGEYVLRVLPEGSCWTQVAQLGSQFGTVADAFEVSTFFAEIYLFEAPAQGTYWIETFGDLHEVLPVLGLESCEEPISEFGAPDAVIELAAGERIVIAVAAGGATDYELRVTPLDCWTRVAELGTTEGTTVGETDEFGACGGESSPDAAHVFVAPANGFYSIDAMDSSYSYVLTVLDQECNELITCSDAANAAPADIVALFLEAGQQIVIVVDGAQPGSAGDYVLTIELDVHYRVNCGGIAMSDPTQAGPDWSADTSAAFSPFSNVSESVSQASTLGTVITPDPTVLDSMPLGLFSSERYDRPSGEEMKWTFPVPNGLYEVRLGFCEIYGGTSQPGQRVFSVHLESELRLEDFDAVEQHGFGVATVRTWTLEVTDGSVDIEFSRGVENPSIKSIEIVPANPAPTSYR